MAGKKLIELGLTRKVLRIGLNEGLYPLELASILYWTNTFYNIRLFTYALEIDMGNGEFPYFIISKDYIRNTKAAQNNLRSIIENYFHQEKLKEFNVEVINAIIQRFKTEYKLDLKRVNYNSPGSVDGLGIGKIAEEVKDFIIKNKQLNFDKQQYSDETINREIKKYKELEELEDLISSNEHRKRMDQLEELKKIEQLRAEKMKNIEKFIELGTVIGVPSEQLKKQVYKGLNEILKLEENNQIDNISVVDEDE